MISYITQCCFIAVCAAALAIGLPGRSVAQESPGFSATYFSNLDFTGTSVVRNDEKIDFQWGHQGPGIPGIGNETYSVIWRGRITASTSEVYTFTALSDDGVLVWVEGKLVIGNWTDHAPSENAGSLQMAAGRAVNLVVRYYQNKGDSAMRLWWSSPSVPKQLVPASSIQPTDNSGSRLAVLSETESRTNPAWLWGTARSDATSVSVTGGGHSFAVARQAPDTWHASNATAPLGVTLTPDVPLQLFVAETSSHGIESMTTTLTWAETDLANLPYSLESIPVRVGDKLLLTIGGAASKVEIDTAYNGSDFVARNTGGPGSRFQVSYGAPGVYDIRGKKDGTPSGRLQVVVVSVDFQGPIADEIAFHREKDVVVTPAQAGTPLLFFTSNDLDAMQVDHVQSTGIGAKLKLLPFVGGDRRLQARLQSPDGPIVGEIAVDTFRLHTTATSTIVLVDTYPDGTAVAQGALIMSPRVPDLDIVMTTFVSGITFEDSTTRKEFSSNSFTARGDGSFEYVYRLLKAPISHANLCHTFRALQRGVAVSP